MTDIQELDAVVVGASTRGLVATYVLSAFGFRAVLLERAPFIGSADGSFQLSDGTWFDFGMHVLDDMRSPMATHLFRHVVGQRVNRLKLKRAMVLRGHIVPYAPEPSSLPDELKQLLHPGELTDDIGDELPTRDRLAKHYGAGYADLIYDEVLPSYPTENRHREFGVDESELLVNIYPWFFPRARRTPKQGDISRAFHDKLRSGIDQHILYPLEGGFGGFCRGFVESYDADRIEVVTGAADVAIHLGTGKHEIDHISASGRQFRATHYFWASGWPDLCRLLDIECQNPATDQIVLGSFRLNEAADTEFHEILFGDPRHKINRISFPGAFRGSDEPLVQIEFAFPVAENRSLDGDGWKQEWLDSLRELGILSERHRVELFDFKTRSLHFNGYGMEGVKLIDADAAKVDPGSNVHPIVPSMSNLNLNSHIPLDVEYVTRVLSDDIS